MEKGNLGGKYSIRLDQLKSHGRSTIKQINALLN